MFGFLKRMLLDGITIPRDDLRIVKLQLIADRAFPEDDVLVHGLKSGKSYWVQFERGNPVRLHVFNHPLAYEAMMGALRAIAGPEHA